MLHYLFHLPEKFILRSLKHNRYPAKFVDSCMKYFGKNCVIQRMFFIQQAEILHLVMLKFLVQFSFGIRKWLQSWMENQLSQSSLTLLFDLIHALQLKYGALKKLPLHVVNKLLCSCYNANCYGQLKWRSFVRSSEHFRNTPLTRKQVKGISHYWSDISCLEPCCKYCRLFSFF